MSARSYRTPSEHVALVQHARANGLIVTTVGESGAPHYQEVKDWWAETYPDLDLYIDKMITNLDKRTIHTWIVPNLISGAHLKLRWG